MKDRYFYDIVNDNVLMTNTSIEELCEVLDISKNDLIEITLYQYNTIQNRIISFYDR